MGSKKYYLKIQSSLSELNKLHAFVEEISDDYNINNNYFGNIVLSLNEAVENVIIHAHKNDITKEIEISFTSNQVGLEFLVKDNGEGFDLSQVPDPTEDKNDESKGRGIYILKSLSDDLSYDNETNTLKMIFKISSINKELSSKRANLLKSYQKENAEKLIND